MSQQELLKEVVQALDRIGCPYMITGSVVSSLQGEPRSTHDIDLVVSIRPDQVGQLVEAFPAPRFYLDESAVRDAIRGHEMFNLIDSREGSKVDFWMLTDDPYDQSRFSRKYEEEFDCLKIQVSSPEDTILAKLILAKLSGGSEKQFMDALRIYEIQFEKLDKGYMEYWARELGIEKLF